jgi:hypothetical protein
MFKKAVARAVTNDIPTAITAALQNVARPAHPACLMILIRLSSMGFYDAGGGRILDGEAYNTAQLQMLIGTRVLFFIEEKLFFFFQVFHIRLHI